MYDDITHPGSYRPAPHGICCRACGRIEPDPGARFCGVCGATIKHALGGGSTADTVQVALTSTARGYREPAPTVQASASMPPVATPGESDDPIVYRVPSIGLWGAVRIGSAFSAAFTLLPCLVVAFLGTWGVHALKLLLDSWLKASVLVPVPVVKVSLTMNFVELLHLQALHNLLISWDDRLWVTFALIWLIPWGVWIVAGAFFGLLLGLIYNMVGSMGGGLRIRLTPAESARPAAWSAPLSPGSSPTWAADLRP